MARARWERTRPADYSFTLATSCECLTEITKPVVVVVRDGVVTSRTYVQGGEAVDPRWASYFPSIDGLFTKIDDAATRADRLDADYDGRYGYPQRISIDYDTRMVDDEISLRVSDFHPL